MNHSQNNSSDDTVPLYKKRSVIPISLIVLLLLTVISISISKRILKTNKFDPENSTSVPIITDTFIKTEISIPNTEETDCIPKNKIEIGEVIRVVDGDTIIVNISGVDFRIRYIGMDSPENGSTYGAEATEFNKKLVEGKTVLLIKDVSESDRFGRLLRYVIVDHTFVNFQMVKSGWAESGTWPPDTSCDSIFFTAEQMAEKTGLGLWKDITQSSIDENFFSGEDEINQARISGDSGSECPKGCITPTTNCSIKGNISSSGVKIYHIPGSDSYDDTVITIERGELWFCTENEAIANGWRAPKR